MKLYLVVDENPCFDCSTEEVIGIFDSMEKAEEVRKLDIANWTIREVELNSIVTLVFHARLGA